MWVGRVGEGGKVTKVKAINQFCHKLPSIDYLKCFRREASFSSFTFDFVVKHDPHMFFQEIKLLLRSEGCEIYLKLRCSVVSCSLALCPGAPLQRGASS